MSSSTDVLRSSVSWGALNFLCTQPQFVVLYKCGPVDFLKAMLILKVVFLPRYCIAKRGTPWQTWSNRAENCWKTIFCFSHTNKHLPIIPCCSSLKVGNPLPFHILTTISCTWVGCDSPLCVTSFDATLAHIFLDCSDRESAILRMQTNRGSCEMKLAMLGWMLQ